MLDHGWRGQRCGSPLSATRGGGLPTARDRARNPREATRQHQQDLYPIRIRRSAILTAPTPTGSAAHEVWARAAWAAVDCARDGGLAMAPLFEGLPFDAASLKRRGRVEWHHYCLLVERMEVLAGGTDALQRLLEGGYHQGFPEVRAAAGRLVSPKLLLKFIFQVVVPVLWPPLEVGFEDRGANRARITQRLRAGAR